MGIIAPMRGIRRDAIGADGTTRRLGRGKTTQPGKREVKTGFLRGFTDEKVFSAEQTESGAASRLACSAMWA